MNDEGCAPVKQVQRLSISKDLITIKIGTMSVKQQSRTTLPKQRWRECNAELNSIVVYCEYIHIRMFLLAYQSCPSLCGAVFRTCTFRKCFKQAVALNTFDRNQKIGPQFHFVSEVIFLDLFQMDYCEYFTHQERNRGAPRRSDTVLVLAINYAN